MIFPRLSVILAIFCFYHFVYAEPDHIETYTANFAKSPEIFFSSKQSNWIVLDKNRGVHFEQSRENEGLRARAAIGASYEGILVHVLVDDIKHWQENLSPENAWKGDSLQIAFQTVKDSPVRNLELVVFSPLSSASQIASVYQIGNGLYPEGLLKLVRAQVIRRGTISEYQVFIPWQALYPFNPFESSTLRASFVVNNNDHGARTGYLEWSKGIGESKSTRFYPRITLPEELKVGRIAQKDFVFAYPTSVKLNVSAPLYVLVYGSSSKAAMIQLKSDKGSLAFEKKLPLTAKIQRQMVEIKNFDTKASDEGIYHLVATSSPEIPIVVVDEVPVQRMREKLVRRLADSDEDLSTLNDDAASVYGGVAREMLTYANELLGDKEPAKAQQILTEVETILDKMERSIAAAQAGQKSYSELSYRLRDRLPRIRPEESGVFAERGWFYENGQPVWLNGFVSFIKYNNDWSVFQALRMRLLHVDIHANAILRTPDPKDDVAPRIGALGEALKKHDMLLVAQTPVHYLPDWLGREHPEGKVANTFWHFSPFHPAIKPTLSRFYARAADSLNLFADNVLVNNLTNEPFVFDFSDTGPAVISAFRKWLEDRYDSIESLNRRWGATFRSFEDVGIPVSGSHPPTEEEIPYPEFYDWLTFRRDHITTLFAWMNDEWKKFSNIPTSNKLLGHGFVSETLLGHGAYRTGIDVESISRQTDYLGCDMGMGFGTIGEEVELGSSSNLLVNFVPMAYGYDLLRSFGPEKPLLNTENHLIKNSSPETQYSASYMRASLWGEALHGMGASTMWVWERRPENRDLSDSILTRPETLEAFALASLEINHFLPLVAGISQLPCQIGIISSWPSSIRNPSHVEGSLKAYEGLAFLGRELRFITERGLSRADWGDFKVLVASHVNRLDDQSFSNLQKFVNRGGMIVTIGECFGADEYGVPRDIPEEFAKKLVSFNDAFSPKLLAEKVDSLLTWNDSQANLRLASVKGDIPIGVEWRIIPYRGEEDVRAILLAINWTNETKEVLLRARRPRETPEELIDLNDGKKYSRIVLPPLDVRLMALPSLPEPLHTQ